MPFPIPATTIGANYVQFGGGSLYGSGYLLVANGAVDVQITYGRATGQAGSTLVPSLGAGQYEIVAPAHNLITGINIRAANGAVSSPAQIVQGQLFEPTVPGVIPVGSGVIVAGGSQVNAAPTTGQITVANTSSLTFVMGGIGAAGATITPKGSGNVLFVVTFGPNNTNASALTKFRPCFGDSALIPTPANGAAPVGTFIGRESDHQFTNTADSEISSLHGTALGLTVGHTYWFDVQFAVAAGTGGFGSITYSVVEV